MNIGWGGISKGPGQKSSCSLMEVYMVTMSFVTTSQESLKKKIDEVHLREKVVVFKALQFPGLLLLQSI